MKKLRYYFQPIHRSKFESVTLLLLRLIVGAAFFQLLAEIAEFGGGIVLLFGVK